MNRTDETAIQTSEDNAVDMYIKLPIIIILGFILVSLGRGMYFLAKDDGSVDKTRVVRSLTIRIVLSLALFALLIAGTFLGFIEPHGS